MSLPNNCGSSIKSGNCADPGKTFPQDNSPQTSSCSPIPGASKPKLDNLSLTFKRSRGKDFDTIVAKLERRESGGLSPAQEPLASTSSDKKDCAQNCGKCPTLTFIENFLECTICLDFPSSPIMVCTNGHILCGQCTKNFTACPTCKDKTLSPSPVAEKLSREADKKIQCVYFGSGCKGGVLSTKFVEHVAVCYFRDVPCPLYNCGLSFPLHKYTEHLKTHKVAVYDGPEYISNYNFYKHYIGEIKWSCCIVNFDDQEFLFHAQISQNKMIFYTWVSLLGDKALADKYICEIKLLDQETASVFGCIWTIPILPFHEFPNEAPEAQAVEVCKIMRIPMPTIQNYSKTFQDANGTCLSFCVTYEIKVA